MEAPKPNMTKNDKKEIIFKFKDKDNSFTITFSDGNDSLGISISEENSIPSINYSAKFTLDELKDLNNFFKMFDSIEQLIPELNNICIRNQVKINQEKQSLNLILALPLTVVQEVNLPIPQDELDSNKVIASLCQTVNELNKKIKYLTSGEIPEEQLEENLKSEDILKNEEEKNMLINWILKAMKSTDKKVKMTLLYKIKEHGDNASTFHGKCDNQGPTLTLVRDTRGYRFGGFTNQSWASRYNPNYGGNGNVSDSNAFLFSLEYKEKYPSYDGSCAIYDCTSYGPCFGGSNDLLVTNSCLSNFSSCNFPYYYCGTRSRALCGGVYNFKVNELEVYKIDII